MEKNKSEILLDVSYLNKVQAINQIIDVELKKNIKNPQ